MSAEAVRKNHFNTYLCMRQFIKRGKLFIQYKILGVKYNTISQSKLIEYKLEHNSAFRKALLTLQIPILEFTKSISKNTFFSKHSKVVRFFVKTN